MTFDRKKSTIITEKTVKPKSLKATHYVDKAELLAALERRKISASKRDENFIGSQLILICENLANKNQFRNYPFLEDMISDGIWKCWKAVDNFDPSVTQNPFAYFTQVCYYAFLERIKVEKKNMYVKFKASSEALIHGEVADIAHGGSEITDSLMSNLDVPQDYIDDYIEKYEESNNISYKKSKKAKPDTQMIVTVSEFFDD